MDVVHGIQFAARLAGIAQHGVARTLSNQRLLDVRHAHRRRPDAADGQRGASDAAGGIFGEQHGGGDNREIAVAAGKLDKAMTVPIGPQRKPSAGQQLVGLERRRHIGDRK